MPNSSPGPERRPADIDLFRALSKSRVSDGAADTPQPISPPPTRIQGGASDLLTAFERAEQARAIVELHGVNPILGRVLAARGFLPGTETEQFLRPTLELLPKPELLKGTRRFCGIISGAARAKDKVGIIHDYDVDGTMSAVILASALTALKIPHRLFPPDRSTHGYGVHPALVREAADRGYKILACLDVGTTNHRAIALARELGMKVIIIDHHEMKPKSPRARVPSPPQADAFINPHRAGCGFADEVCCAAGLTWFAVHRLRKQLLGSSRAKSRKGAEDIDLSELLGYAAVATVADVVPLTGVNRVMVRCGLPALQSSSRIGVRKLLDHAGVKGPLRAADVAFKIGPRINAAGRMMEPNKKGDPGAAVVTKLFLTDKLKKAEKLADTLNLQNQLRKTIEAKVVADAELMMRTLGRLPDGIVLWGHDFHAGVIGLGAARIAERYHRPTLVFQVRSDGTAKCSARGGVKGFSVIQAFRDLEQELTRAVFKEYGGHEGAGGASVAAEHLPLVREGWDRVCARQLDRLEREPVIRPDLELSLKEFSDTGAQFVQQLDLLEPTGAANLPVKFLVRGVRILSARILKGRHLELMLQQRDPTSGEVSYAPAILWHRTEHPALTLPLGSTPARGPEHQVAAQRDHPVDIVCHPGMNQQNRHQPNQTGVFLQIMAAQIAEPAVCTAPQGSA